MNVTQLTNQQFRTKLAEVLASARYGRFYVVTHHKTKTAEVNPPGTAKTARRSELFAQQGFASASDRAGKLLPESFSTETRGLVRSTFSRLAEHCLVPPEQVSVDRKGALSIYFFSRSQVEGEPSRFVWISIDPDGEAAVMFSDRSSGERQTLDLDLRNLESDSLGERIESFLVGDVESEG